MPEKLYMDKEWLYKQYWELKKSPQQIENEFNIGYTTISRWLDKFEIKKRTMVEYHNIKNIGYRNKEWLLKQYIELKKSIKQISIECGTRYETIRLWLVKFKIPRRKNYNRLKPRPKCLNCGKECRNLSNKYCSQKCGIDYRYDKYIRLWLNHEIKGITGGKTNKGNIYYSPSNPVIKYIREKYPECQQCGWSNHHSISGNLLLEIHHKDGNRENGYLENLEHLCPNCHSMTENFGCHGRIKYVEDTGLAPVKLFRVKERPLLLGESPLLILKN